MTTESKADKILIVTADDLGLSASVNAGIVAAHQRGIVTSTSLMANGPAFEDAVLLVRDHPELSVGIHLVLVEERPVSEPEDVRSLLDDDGRLLGANELWKGLCLGKVEPEDLDREIRAQLRKLVQGGVRPSHLDGHRHLHLYPQVLPLVVVAARDFDIAWIRTTDVTRELSGWWSRRARLEMRKRGIRTSDHFLGASSSGHLDEETLIRFIENLRPGVTEILCHPGQDSPDLRSRYGRWGFDWQGELDALTSKKVRALLQSRGVVLWAPHRSSSA